MGRIFQALARPGPYDCNVGPARPKVIIKISARARPGREIEISVRARPETKYKILARPGPNIVFSNFGPDRLALSDLKTDSFTQLHKINIIFVDNLFFCYLLKRFSNDCFPL